MLTATLYPQMKDGPSLLVSGELFADGRWHVSVFLHQRSDGTWRVGRETDSEVYVLHHVHASVPARAGSHRVAGKTERRELLRQIYEWIDKQTGRDSMTQILPGLSSKETKIMEIMRCAIYTKHGKGPQCPKQAAIGKDICGTHAFLEVKLGPLPRQPMTKVTPAAPVGGAIMRMTPDSVTAADFESAPASTVEPAAPVQPPQVEEPKKIRKTRSDKGKLRVKATPFA